MIENLTKLELIEAKHTAQADKAPDRVNQDIHIDTAARARAASLRYGRVAGGDKFGK